MALMQASHVNAFIDATKETFKSMCGVSFRRSGDVRKVDGEIVACDELMTICGFSGSVKGAAMLATPLETGKKIISAFMMEDISEINTDLMDGWGELVNILTGAAEAKMPGIRFNLSLPSTVFGENAHFYAKAGNPFVVIPFQIKDMGPFSLGVSMEIPD